jgi:phosphoribosylanthranilate isomerase
LRSVFVKICGITDEADALMAVAMGADALGFVFAPSTRQVTSDRVRAILREVPDEVPTIGVFRDDSAQRIVDVVDRTGLSGVQLHGHESPGEAMWIRARVPFVVQAFAAGDARLGRVDDYGVDAVMIDAASPGSGQAFDWALVGDLPQRHRVILAGGLRPENVALAIETVGPWGVDVSTGVESGPGRKDVLLVRRFVEEARSASERRPASAFADDPLPAGPRPAPGF